jgi:cell division protein ZapE
VPEHAVIEVMQGRTLEVKIACAGVARFHFDELCNRPLGAADYLAITKNFHTVFVEQIPELSIDNRNELRRFILLIDELYQRHTRVVCSAATPAHELLKIDPNSPHDEAFAFERCVSRLLEMQSEEYLTAFEEKLTAWEKHHYRTWNA